MFHSNLEQAKCCIFLSIPAKHWIPANGSSAVVFIIVLTLPPFPKLTEAQETASFVTRKNVSACSLATSIGQSRMRAWYLAHMQVSEQLFDLREYWTLSSSLVINGSL